MKKLIFGIIGVFCLQVALIGNTWLNARVEPVAEQPWAHEMASVDEPFPEFAPVNSTYLRTTAYAPRRRSSMSALPKVAARRPETLSAVARNRPRPATPSVLLASDLKKAETRAPIEKKSLFAKAWPVIKKPYSWVRTLASKLD